MIFWIDLVFLFIALNNALFWPRVRRARIAGSIAVLIPARDEEANIEACLATVLPQSVREILVYDDHSSDNTSALVTAISDARLCLLQAAPLPAGWFGKSFACAQMAVHSSSDWLLFLDADARLEPDACERMLAEATHRKLTLLSCWPRLQAKSFPEAVLMPMLNWVVFSVFPAPLSLFRNEPSLALAHGACLMVHRATYQLLGGHGAVRKEIFEDTRLAQLWRENGERGLALDGSDLVSVRMYSSLNEIWRGFQKNFYRAFRHRANFWIFLALHFLAFVLPFLILDWRACAAVMAARAALLIRFRQSAWSLVLHPFAELFLIALGVSSWMSKHVEWKGRQYT